VKYWFAAIVLLVGLLGACTPKPGGGTNSGTIKAAQGGVVEAGGAKLTIPPGALSQDANVTLQVGAKPTEPAENPLQPAGPAVSLDLGGASLKQAATLELPTDVQGKEGDLVILEKNPNPGPDEPQIRVHAAKPADVCANSGVPRQNFAGGDWAGPERPPTQG